MFLCVQSVSLWCDYIKFVQDYDPLVREKPDDGILKLRNLFERALTAAGLHISEGSKIWEAYRKFEQAILDTINKDDIEVSSDKIFLLSFIYSIWPIIVLFKVCFASGECTRGLTVHV